MKKIFILIVVISVSLSIKCIANEPSAKNSKAESLSAVIPMTNDLFKKNIYNYDTNKQWKYEGNKPVIIDFYASWCGPCRKMSPILDEIAKEYAGKIVVYKVDTDAETMLSQKMGISSLPTLLFIPVTGQPQGSVGLIPKESVIKAISEILLVK